MECHVGISLNRTKTRVRVMDTLQGAALIGTFIGVLIVFARPTRHGRVSLRLPCTLGMVVEAASGLSADINRAGVVQLGGICLTALAGL
jgi:hypothetical protein